MNNYTVLVEGREPIAAYDNEYKGKQYFHIRRMYHDGSGTMQPGKGLGVPIELRDELLKAIKNYPKQLKVAS